MTSARLARNFQRLVQLQLRNASYATLHTHKAFQLGSSRPIQSSAVCRDSSFTNILAGDIPLPVQVNSVSANGIKLADGLLIPSACIFLGGKVFLWDPPSTLWDGWTTEHFEIFEVVVPKPGICSS